MSKPIELTPEEITARTSYCGDCHAPVGMACHTIRWTNERPYVLPRPYHSRRLKMAKKMAAQKEAA